MDLQDRLFLYELKIKDLLQELEFLRNDNKMLNEKDSLLIQENLILSDKRFYFTALMLTILFIFFIFYGHYQLIMENNKYGLKRIEREKMDPRSSRDGDVSVKRFNELLQEVKYLTNENMRLEKEKYSLYSTEFIFIGTITVAIFCYMAYYNWKERESIN